METLELINEALCAIHSEVHYGTAVKHPPASPWNYTVFWRDSTRPGQNLTGGVDRYGVAVVRESYVPESELGAVVAAMEAIPGVRLDTSASVEYAYDVKPGGSDVVEMMTVRFTRGRKRG